MLQYQWDRSSRGVIVSTLLGTMIGCGGGSNDAPSSHVLRSQGVVTLSGNIVDGPVIDSEITVLDAFGRAVAQTTGDGTATYRVEISSGTAFPITIKASGGTDLVTQRTPDVPLEITLADARSGVANISPLSTFAARVARCASGNRVTAEHVDVARSLVARTLGMGFDAERFGNPSTLEVDAGNIADLVFANEGLGEIVRRTAVALDMVGQALAPSDIVGAIACDLAHDGLLDGVGDAASPRLAASFRAASAGVLLEMIAKRLRVDGEGAMTRMDDSIGQVLPILPGRAQTAAVKVTPQLVRQARDALSVFGDERFTEYVMMLDQLALAALPEAVAGELGTGEGSAFDVFTSDVASADEPTLAQAMDNVRALEEAQTPMVAFAASPTHVSRGGTARLSWAAAAATHCAAHGAWTGGRAPEGTYVTTPLGNSAVFRLDCTGTGGTISSEVMVAVAGDTGSEPAPSPGGGSALPTVALSASTASVANGGQVTLTWASEHATLCTASGAWSGALAPDGSRTVGPMASSGEFALECSGVGGTARDTVTVAVASAPAPGAVSVALSASPRWVAPGSASMLSWNSREATSCTASGGWSGAKPTSGSAATGPISADRTFNLSCAGPSGSAIAMTTVSPRSARLSWQAPPELADSLIDGVVGFRIYVGSAPGDYDATIDVNDPRARQHVLSLTPGTHYWALTARYADGHESARSNEVSKTIE